VLLIMKNKVVTLIVCAAMFIITIIIGYNYIYKPQIERIDDKKAQLEKEIEKNKIAYEIHGLQREINEYVKYFPKASDATWLVSQVTNKVKKSRIELLSVKPEDVKRFKNYDIMSVKLQIRSTYHNLGDFISKMESSKDFMRVNSVKILKYKRSETESDSSGSTEITDKSGNVMANIEVVISAFYLH